MFYHTIPHPTSLPSLKKKGGERGGKFLFIPLPFSQEKGRGKGWGCKIRRRFQTTTLGNDVLIKKSKAKPQRKTPLIKRGVFL